MAPNSTQTRKRIVLIDDHAIVREGLARLFNEQPDLLVVGEAPNVEQGLAIIAEQSPDLVVLDLSLPGTDGIEVLRQARVKWKNLPILVLSMHDEALHAERLLRAGAMGYVMKQEASERLLAAVRQVLRGERSISPTMAAHMVDRLVNPKARENESPIARLSDREFEVFTLIAEGIGPTEIAKRLNLSIKTVESHREHVKSKLNARTSADLVRLAVENGLGKR
jgi:DNA-binding NarL/FixJ family response regulator